MSPFSNRNDGVKLLSGKKNFSLFMINDDHQWWLLQNCSFSDALRASEESWRTFREEQVPDGIFAEDAVGHLFDDLFGKNFRQIKLLWLNDARWHTPNAIVTINCIQCIAM